MAETKEFLSLEEVADLLGVNYQLIYKLVRAGDLRSARIGKVYRIARHDLDDYLERAKSPARGGVCSVCGVLYHSQLSLKHACPECAAAICVDCWTRRGARRCPQHGSGSTASAAGGADGGVKGVAE